MKKNYFIYPIELFKQMLTNHVISKLDNDESTPDFFEVSEINTSDTKGEVRKMNFAFSIDIADASITSCNVTINMSFSANPDPSRVYAPFKTLTLTAANSRFLLETNVQNISGQTFFKFEINGTIVTTSGNIEINTYTITDNISDNVEIVQYGLIPSSRRSVKFCRIGLLANPVPNINMYPPVKQ